MAGELIPLFPLRTVLFPGGYLPLRIFERRYLDMVRDCSASGSHFGVCLADNVADKDKSAELFRVGTTAEICDFHTLEDGLLGITARGLNRFQVHATRTRDDGLLMGEVEIREDAAGAEVPEQYAVLSMVTARFMEQLASAYPDFQPRDLQDALWVGYRLAELLPLELQEKQQLLEIHDPLLRLQRLVELLPRFQEPSEA